MEEQRATLRTVDDRPALRFERRLAHSPEKVWRAVTDPAEMVHWFPAAVETERAVGAEMRFTFEGGDDPTHGRILQLDPPKVYAFRWNQDVLRFELFPDGPGCRLVFTHTLGGGWGRLTAGRTAAGWDVCLSALSARLDGEPSEASEPPSGWADRIGAYVEVFGLAEGETRESGDGHLVRFARDLVWKPVEEVWNTLAEQDAPLPGAEPPAWFTNPYVPAGAVTEAGAPRVLEYEWLHDGEPAGRVRWEFTHDPAQGTRVVLTQTVPARLADLRATALAAWQAHLEVLFAAVQGEARERAEGRVEELRKLYEHRLG
ncbi:SRPBCC domain-containing protein [Streptosporangium sp. V21-05]|uniref:SRPBCC domain-containing protein n=1 Tax=Streptosporangium sp. V21-05 TaxID=3446115 RepID=UPI003F53A880